MLREQCYAYLLQTECQDKEDEDGANSDDPEAEQDEMLIEYAGDIVPNLGKAMTPDDFSQYFGQLLPLFANRTVRLVVFILYKLCLGCLKSI